MGGAQSLQCRVIDILSLREPIKLGLLGSLLNGTHKMGEVNLFGTVLLVFSSLSDYYCCSRCVNELCSFSSGFESILEGLFGPGLVQDLTLFKGKSTFSQKSTTKPFVITL